MMSGLRRKLSSLAYFTRKTYWTMITIKPPLLIIAFAAVGLSIFLIGGGVYDLLEQPIIGYPKGRKVLFFYPYAVHEQVFLESLTTMILYGIGIAGLLLTYQSTKYAYKPRQAFMLLLMGCVLILIAYVYIENILWLKSHA